MTRFHVAAAAVCAIALAGCGGAAEQDESRAAGTALAAFANIVTPPGGGRNVANPFHPIRVVLSAGENEGAVTFHEFDVPPMSPGSPPHTHTREDEYFFVVEGTLDVMSGEAVMRLEEGTFASLNRGTPHMFWNGSDGPTKLLVATTGGSFEAFMDSVAPRLAAEKPEGPEAAGAVVGALAAEFGIEISMEKMPAEAAPFYGQ